MTHREHSYCHFCGAVHIANDWPRKCRACSSVIYRNPLPVVVVLQPVGDGLLIVRRGEGHASGQLALPGGYLEAGESWMEGAARELREETGVRIDPRCLRACGVYSARDDSLAIFTLATPIEPTALPSFTPTVETLERHVASSPVELVFRSHTTMMQRYFAGTLQLLEGI